MNRKDSGLCVVVDNLASGIPGKTGLYANCKSSIRFDWRASSADRSCGRVSLNMDLTVGLLSSGYRDVVTCRRNAYTCPCNQARNVWRCVSSVQQER